MPVIKVEFAADVKAEAERLWDILTDVKSWPDRKLITNINSSTSGLIKEGSSFVVEHDGLKWNLTVTRIEKPKKICWSGKWIGLQATHEWEFIEEGGKTKAVNRESISGWMTILLYPIVKRRLPRTDEKWLNDLKSKAESL